MDYWDYLHNNTHYNDEPVLFCKHCLSLNIQSTGNIDFCDKCGSTDILETDIKSWERLYKEKYNEEHLKR